MATPPEDERFAAWVLQVTAHEVLSAVLDDEVNGPHAGPYGVDDYLGLCDRAEVVVTAMAPLFRGLHPELIAELNGGVACVRAGAKDQAMTHLLRVWEPLVVLAGTELDLPTPRKDDPDH